MDRKSKFTFLALGMSLVLYGVERNLPLIEASHNLDLNGDGKLDRITEEGYSFFPRYEAYLQNDKGKFVRDNSFSRKEIASKLKN